MMISALVEKVIHIFILEQNRQEKWEEVDILSHRAFLFVKSLRYLLKV